MNDGSQVNDGLSLSGIARNEWSMFAFVIRHLPWGLFLLVTSAASALFAEGASARAYVYLEPSSVRFECLVPLKGMLTLLAQPSAGEITPDAQQKLRDAARDQCAGWLQVKLDGRDAGKGKFRAMVVKGVPGRTELPKPGEVVSTDDAMLGLLWEHDLTAVPEKIEFGWTNFNDMTPSIYASVIAGSQSEDHELNRGASSFEWLNRGRLSPSSPLASVPPLPPLETIRLPLASMVWTLCGLIFLNRFWRKGRKGSSRGMMAWMSILFGAAVLWPIGRITITSPWATAAPVTPGQAERILTPLLRNVYRAFEQQEEREIYDVLEKSIEGDLLQRIYLQTIGALTLDAQDSTRARVTDLDVRVEAVHMTGKGRGFTAETQWTALGTVGHWGHQHQRINRYTARVTVDAIPSKNVNAKKGATSEWKMVGLEVEQETRM